MRAQLHVNSILLFILGSEIVISTEVNRELGQNVPVQGCTRPRIVPGHSLSLKAGSPLNLTCQMQCNQLRPDVQWIRELHTGETLVISNSPNLVIKSLNFDHSGKLQCYAHINSLHLISDSVTLSVVGPPYIDTEEEITNMTTNVGDDLDIEVLYCSRPPASVSWILTSGDATGGHRMLLSGRKHGRFSSNTRWYDSEGHCYTAHLHISSLRMIDTGTFALQLDNQEGGIQRIFHIIVTSPIITETTSIWFFVLFFFACFLLVLNRFTHLGMSSKPAVVV